MIILEKSKNKKLKNNILSIGQAASKAKKENPNVINSTSGMLFDENNKLYTFNSVKKAMNELTYESMFKYSDTSGTQRFKDSIVSWIFGDKIYNFTSFYMGVVATPGGSGAIALTYSTYLNRGDKVLLPKVMWETYITYAEERECSYLTYDIYDDCGKFNVQSIKEGIEKLDNQENVLLVINDPCQNPIGFCMNDEDYDALISLLNSYKRNIVLLMDVAYFDYYSSNGEVVRNRFAKLSQLNDNVLTIFAFSGSKTFGLYGLRVGAAICLSRNEQEVTYFKNCYEYIARASWSSVSTLGTSLIEELVLNEEYKELFREEVKFVSNLLKDRTSIFIEEAKKVNLQTLPYERGFFICIPTNDPVKLMEALKKDDVYVIVTKTCIRIALCAINKDEARRLPLIIKNRMEIENL